MFFQYRNFSRVQNFGKKKSKLYSLPKTLRHHKYFKHPGETFPKEITQSDQCFRQHEKNPMFPQAAQTFCMIWKARQCQWFNIDG